MNSRNKYLDGDYQRAVGDLVHREVICNLCQTMDMYSEHCCDEYLEDFARYDYEQAALDAGWREWEDVSAAELAAHDYDTSGGTVWDYFNVETGEYVDADGWGDLCADQDIDADLIEIYEYWAVSSWFARELQAHGEIVVDVLDFQVWGRSTTGQAIYLDRVICDIFDGTTAGAAWRVPSDNVERAIAKDLSLRERANREGLAVRSSPAGPYLFDSKTGRVVSREWFPQSGDKA